MKLTNPQVHSAAQTAQITLEPDQRYLLLKNEENLTEKRECYIILSNSKCSAEQDWDCPLFHKNHMGK